MHGSTDLLEQLGTEAWVEVMNRIFQILEGEIYRLGGKVDQFRGDGLVAFFGATTAHEDDPERAVLAALAMQDSLKTYAAEMHAQSGIDLSLRVGVNTGEVIVTSIGDSRQYSEDTAMGEAIALAARMETAAEPGTVLVSENTYQLVHEQFEWEPLGKIMVKGISHPIAVYRPLALRPDSEQIQRYDLGNPLVGREAEVAILKQCIADLYEGVGGIVMITGDRGIGKSLLMAEVRHTFARQRALLLEAREHDAIAPHLLPDLGLGSSATQTDESTPHLAPEQNGRQGLPQTKIEQDIPPELFEIRAHCRSYDQSQPYAMWLDLLRNWLAFSHDESKEQQRERLRKRCEALWGERMSDYYPYLVNFLSLPLEPSFAERIRHLDAEGLRQQYFTTIRNWVAALVQQRPLIFTLNDIHWADATSLELLKHCLPLCDQEPLLWVLIFRPDRTSPMWRLRYNIETEYPHRLTTLALQPFTAAQSRAFIEQLIGRDTLPPETEQILIDKSEGNPYYIQELIRSLIGQGVLTQQVETDERGVTRTRWVATRAVTSLELPDSLQSLLLARIDRLTPDEQRVLQIAAVIGSIFWSNVLQALYEDIAQLKLHLTALQRAQLIVERGRIPGMGVEYAFKSTLIRDVAYDSLLSSQRVAYHLQIAEYLEKRFNTETLTQYRALYYSALAYHYRQAGKLERELFYVLQMAQQALEVYANAEAIEHYNHALNLLDMLEEHASESQRYTLLTQRFEVLNGRRKVYQLTGNFDAARHDAEALLPLARQLSDDPVWLIDALLQQTGIANFQNQEEIRERIPMAEEALKLSRQLGDQRREMQSLIAIVNQRLALGDPSWQEPGERALELAQQLGDEHYEARLLIGMGRIYAMSDQSERGIEYLQAAAALSITQAPDDKLTQISLLDLLGLQHERSGDYYRLLTEYQQERLYMSREIGHRPLESDALLDCGIIQGIYLGDHETGLVMLEASRNIIKGTPSEAQRLLYIAFIEAERGNLDVAKGHLAATQQFESKISLDVKQNLIQLHLNNLRGIPDELEEAAELVERVCQMSDNPLLSRQYAMAAACKATDARLQLAQVAATDEARRRHVQAALENSALALKFYESFGFVQVPECTSEEILFRRYGALLAAGQPEEAEHYLDLAYDEMMRKHALIPSDTPFYLTYLENIPLHRQILTTYAAMVGIDFSENNS